MFYKCRCGKEWQRPPYRSNITKEGLCPKCRGEMHDAMIKTFGHTVNSRNPLLRALVGRKGPRHGSDR